VGSHAPERQTRIPTAGEQVDTVLGVDGSGVPFASFGWHMPAPPDGASHHFVGDMQSVSTVQAVVHVPLVVSHVGWSLSQSADVRHPTHRFAVVSQNGVAPPHCESLTQATQRFWFAPLVAQMPDRQTVAPLVASQGPSPFA
jgi:hypothetical protein